MAVVSFVQLHSSWINLTTKATNDGNGKATIGKAALTRLLSHVCQETTYY